MRYSLNALRAKVQQLTTDSLETIAATILDLEADLEEMTVERDALQKRVDELEHPHD